MRKSIATVSLGGTLPEKLEAIAAAGFEGVEIFEPNLASFTGTAREIGRRTRELGLSVDLFQPLRDFEGVTDERFGANLNRAEMAFDTMDHLGASMLSVCANTEPAAIDDDARAASQLRALAERASRRGFRIGYEALAWSTRVCTFNRALKIVEQADHANLGLVLDSFHTLIRPDDWSSLKNTAANRIFFVQLGDASRNAPDPLTVRRHHSRLPGQGELDVPQFLRAVMDTGYVGTISLEIFNERTPLSPPDAARASFKSLEDTEARARQLA
jgi:4-hydroxyphenylpyruvate dioxygenase